jgi:hypothetical protein
LLDAAFGFRRDEPHDYRRGGLERRSGCIELEQQRKHARMQRDDDSDTREPSGSDGRVHHSFLTQSKSTTSVR